MTSGKWHIFSFASISTKRAIIHGYSEWVYEKLSLSLEAQGRGTWRQWRCWIALYDRWKKDQGLYSQPWPLLGVPSALSFKTNTS